MAKSLDIDAPGAVTKPFDVVDSSQGPPDLGGFTQLMLEHQAMVFSLAYHFLQNRASAEDLTQEVFLGLYRNLHTIRPAVHVKHWLRQAAKPTDNLVGRPFQGRQYSWSVLDYEDRSTATSETKATDTSGD